MNVTPQHIYWNELGWGGGGGGWGGAGRGSNAEKEIKFMSLHVYDTVVVIQNLLVTSRFI